MILRESQSRSAELSPRVDLESVARVIAEASEAVQVIFFGSRARNHFDDSSDWDFLLVMPESWQPVNYEQSLIPTRAAHDALWKSGFRQSVDLVTMPIKSFRAGDSVLARVVQQEGITIFDGTNHA
jgi:predicted nucleotidyltransferase